MAHIFQNERSTITLDSIESTQGFNNVPEGVPISIIKENGVLQPTTAAVTPEVNPTGGIEIVGTDIQIAQNDTTVLTYPLRLNPSINKKITSVSNPTDPQDAATKTYADNNIPPAAELAFDYTTVLRRNAIDVEEEALIRSFGQTPMSTYVPEWRVEGNTPIVDTINNSGNEKVIYRLESDVNGANVIIGDVQLSRFQSCHLFGGYVGMEIATTTTTTDANMTVRVPGSNFLVNSDGTLPFPTTATIGIELEIRLTSGTVRITEVGEFGNSTINLNGTSSVSVTDMDGSERIIRVPFVGEGDLFEIRIYCSPSANNSEGVSEGGNDGGGLTGRQYIFVRRIDNDNNNQFSLIANTNYYSRVNTGIPTIAMSAVPLTGFNSTIDIKSFGIVVNNTQMSRDFTRVEMEGKNELQIHIPEFMGNVTLGLPPADSINDQFKITIISDLYGELILEGSEEDGLNHKPIFHNKKRYITTQRDLGRTKEIVYNNTGGGGFSDLTLIEDEPYFSVLKIDGVTGNIKSVYSKYLFQVFKISPGSYLIFNSTGEWTQNPYVCVTPERACVYFSSQSSTQRISINTNDLVSELGVDTNLNIIIQDVN